MYLNHWRLRRRPFVNSNDLSFLLYAKGHFEVLIRLLCAVDASAGVGLLTGENGCGKTYLASKLCRELGDHGHETCLIGAPDPEPARFLRQVLAELEPRVGHGGPGADPFRELRYAALDNLHRGLRTVIVIDDAQLVRGDDLFAEIGRIRSLEENGRTLITTILIGDHALRQRISKLPFLWQRLDAVAELQPLEDADAFFYIAHRLSVAGQTGTIFTEAALRKIIAFSRGIPRVINGICDLALLIGFGERAKLVDLGIVREAIREYTQVRGLAPAAAAEEISHKT
ncbi:MAG TPA: AAA family ATPase [Planctomycetota bacterium]|nr:AAA family ATPase [Planctomycetota bacterium]